MTDETDDNAGEPRELFDAAPVFDDDYLWFYSDRIDADAADAEAGLARERLAIEPPAHVLDLCCGHGRISNRLAADGFTITGFDASAFFLDHAREDASERGVNVDYVHGDMRTLPADWTDRFDGVINWFTAFGYFDDATNVAVLAEIRRVLKPGGRLAMELNNRDGTLRRWRPQHIVERGDDFMLDEVTWDPLTSRSTCHRTAIRNGRVRRFTFTVRMYTFTEIRDALRSVGFTDITAVDRDGEPFTMDARRMVVLAS